MTTSPRHFITAAASVSPLVEQWHRQNLRRHYRTLRQLGMSPFFARHLITDLIKSGKLEVR